MNVNFCGSNNMRIRLNGPSLVAFHPLLRQVCLLTQPFSFHIPLALKRELMRQTINTVLYF
jgi:hypothetical protein